MKFYKKYKDFIPNSFYLRLEKKKRKNENIIISMFLVINLLLLPVNLKSLNILNKKEVKYNDDVSYSDKGSFEIEVISYVLDKLLIDEFEEVYINNNCGEILISSLNNTDRIEEDNIFEVNEVSLVGDDKYKIGVSINEH
ncbi:hypothetical protein [uncultured Clostridium sp.]|uniref:hypothetical protein n=1 Tax=uncultured Clostridium sp. TaxID=59620 RepID=UPI0025FC287F|nr:hypothetical protein [uncultured Clostridium sp.]